MLKANSKIETKKPNDKFVGIFPFEFDEWGNSSGENAGAQIPTTIHVIPVGTWKHDSYGDIVVTDADIREFVMNFNAGIRKGVFITAGHEGMIELPAVGWFTRVEARADGLWGNVEWNDEGKELLATKAFKFFSPEYCPVYEDPQTHQQYRNVLTGGALTKSPYFKELTAIVFSEHNITKKFNDINSMNLKDLLAKKIEDLTPEEKAFIKEHQAELTETEKSAVTSIIDAAETQEEKDAREKFSDDAQAAADAEKAAADAAAAEASKVNASEQKVTITASELTLLRQKADQGQQAFAELEKQKLDMSVRSMVFSESNKDGKFLPKSQANLRSFMASLNQTQRNSFSALLKELPATNLFTEEGSGNAVNATGTDELETKIQSKIKASEGKLKYSEAMKQVLSEDKTLEERYDRELPSARKGKA